MVHLAQESAIDGRRGASRFRRLKTKEKQAMTTNLKSLIGRLDHICRNAVEAAAGMCMSRTHYEVEIEHVLLKLLEVENCDLKRLLHHYGINATRVERELTAALDTFKTGNPRTPVLSPHLPKLIERAWVQASIDYAETRVRSGHLLVALLSGSEFGSVVRESAPELNRIPVEDLAKNLADVVADSVEAGDVQGLPQAAGDNKAPTGKLGKTPGLDQYTVNMTQRAKEGKIDPVLGRDAEIRQMIDILTRRRQNNPILTGEAGVGKTAVVEGLALRIATGDVPPPLKPVQLHSLDLGLLQAGASIKGEFENRLRSVIDEVKRSPHPIIVFIDEAHTLIGAGGTAGQGDAANLLKPPLARGELRTIAATTWSEYKKYFEKDAALARRFQVVKVEEPTEERAIGMLRGLGTMMENHHNVRVLDDAVVQAVRLSHRYISGRQLPDKAVSVLDTACARIAIGQTAIPASIEDARRHIESIRTEQRVLARETATGAAHDERIAELQSEQVETERDLAALEQRWEAERKLVKDIHDVRAQLEADATASAKPEDGKTAPLTAEARQALLAQLAGLNNELETLQGEQPLVQVCVSGQTVGEVISAWTGIPLGKMLRDEINTVLQLKPLLEERVIGQSHALEAIAQRIRTARANLEDPGKPIGVFLLVGPSGVGKTETALALADILYGGERNMVTINMSEYQEAHTVSALKGSPPGYVGYGEGGVLTEAVRRKPYSVVLLDEIEKAHPDVLELFFQVFDKGMMDDAEGREIDFKNTVIILTSNAGTDIVMQECLGTEQVPDAPALAELLRPELQRVFKPAFLGRLTVVPYYPIRDEIMKRIIDLKLRKIKRRIEANHKAEFVYEASLIDAVAQRCNEVDSGARNVDHILSGTLLPEISETVLSRMAEGKAINRVNVSAADSGAFQYSID
jgi:type VI secretion system protein VasG